MTILKIRTHGNVNNPEKIVVLMHGYGSNSADMLGLAKEICASNEGLQNKLLFIVPDAPFAWEGGDYSEARQWFSLISREEAFLLEGLKTARSILLSNIEIWLKNYNLQQENLILSGFSQGAMLSLHTGLRNDEKIAGILAFSGTLIGRETLENDVKQKPKICMIHGTEDEVLPVTYSKIAHKALCDMEIHSQLHTIKYMGHSINEECINIAVNFLLDL